MHAFIDESRRRTLYLVSSVEVGASDVEMVRGRLRTLLLAGQRRLHFVDERNQRRRQLLVQFCRLPIRAQVIAVRLEFRSEKEARRLAIESILGTLDTSVDRLVIESRQGRDHEDRRTIALKVARPDFGRPLHYEHRRPHEEPRLWLADDFAWAAGAGGEWRRHLSTPPVTIVTIGA